jgi:cysteinyl-tRNA synthetase
VVEFLRAIRYELQPMKLYNTLSRSVEEFKPLNPPKVGMYTCGPTVYDYAHIGNFRTYTTADLLLRTLKFNNYDVDYVMNITDVGHLTGDNSGDADTGEDRMEKSAKREGKSAWDIAKFYTDAFLKDYERLHLTPPNVLAKATEHIKEQIELVQTLEKKGFTYKTSDGIYFDTSKFPDYGKLSNLDQIKEGARVEVNPEKKDPRDFALWKFSPENEKRQMEWDSPWGKGFPGWHIECSAMSMKYLGESFDIHVGGIDLSSTHHPNEIAQSEAATGKPFVQFWVHGAFMLVDGKRMSKSLGNNYKVEDIVRNGYSPLSLRYVYMQTHYRQEMNFTWDGIKAADHALQRISDIASTWDKPHGACVEHEKKFAQAIADDLNIPQALAVLWEVIRSDYPSAAKAATVQKFDEVFGFGLSQGQRLVNNDTIPDEIQKLVKQREHFRKNKQFDEADNLRTKIKKMGYDINDAEKGTVVRKSKS